MAAGSHSVGPTKRICAASAASTASCRVDRRRRRCERGRECRGLHLRAAAAPTAAWSPRPPPAAAQQRFRWRTSRHRHQPRPRHPPTPGQPARGNKSAAVGATKGSRSSKSTLPRSRAQPARHTSPRACSPCCAHGTCPTTSRSCSQSRRRAPNRLCRRLPAEESVAGAGEHRSIGGRVGMGGGRGGRGALVVMARAEESQDRQNAQTPRTQQGAAR